MHVFGIEFLDFFFFIHYHHAKIRIYKNTFFHSSLLSVVILPDPLDLKKMYHGMLSSPMHIYYIHFAIDLCIWHHQPYIHNSFVLTICFACRSFNLKHSTMYRNVKRSSFQFFLMKSRSVSLVLLSVFHLSFLHILNIEYIC